MFLLRVWCSGPRVVQPTIVNLAVAAGLSGPGSVHSSMYSFVFVCVSQSKIAACEKTLPLWLDGLLFLMLNESK